jgi:hypothetical protein
MWPDAITVDDGTTSSWDGRVSQQHTVPIEHLSRALDDCLRGSPQGTTSPDNSCHFGTPVSANQIFQSVRCERISRAVSDFSSHLSSVATTAIVLRCGIGSSVISGTS